MQELSESKAKSVIFWNFKIKIAHWSNCELSTVNLACVHAPLGPTGEGSTDLKRQGGREEHTQSVG